MPKVSSKTKNSWVRALSKWNTGKDTFCVPRRGTNEHAEVKALMNRAGDNFRRFGSALKRRTVLSSPHSMGDLSLNSVSQSLHSSPAVTEVYSPEMPMSTNSKNVAVVDRVFKRYGKITPRKLFQGGPGLLERRAARMAANQEFIDAIHVAKGPTRKKATPKKKAPALVKGKRKVKIPARFQGMDLSDVPVRFGGRGNRRNPKRG